MNKKAALELSVNTIVIVVLAMTLLGLGLAFIRNIMLNTGETVNGVSKQIRQQILNDLKRPDQELSMPQFKYEFSSGSQKTMAFGIKNMLDTTLNFTVKIIDLNDNKNNCTGNNKGEHNSVNKASADRNCAAFQWDQSPQILKAGEPKVYAFQIFAPEKKSSYMYKLLIWDNGHNEEYVSKSIFVKTK